MSSRGAQTLPQGAWNILGILSIASSMPELSEGRGVVDVVAKELELLHAPLDDLFGAEVSSPQKVRLDTGAVVRTDTCRGGRACVQDAGSRWRLLGDPCQVQRL